MRYENYKSDIKLEVTLKLGGVAIAVPSHDFEVRFTSGDNGKAYVCSYLNGVWNKCAPIENGSKLECYLDNHGLGPGRLKALFVDHAPDGSMPDGDKVTAVPSKLDIELITGAGDDATSVAAEVVVDIYSAVADARAIADELESKLASGYFKGDPGDPGAPGTPGQDGVSVTSVVQTTTSTTSEGENVITVTLSNGNSSTFVVKNGAKGDPGVTPDISGKQDTLVSGTNIKTINNGSILGSGDIALATASQLSTYCPIIEDTRSSVATSITGVAPFASLEDGQRIILHLNLNAGTGNSTLNLTLSDGTTTGAKTIKVRLNTSFAIIGNGYPCMQNDYLPLVYNAYEDSWLMLGVEKNTTYAQMPQSRLDEGTATGAYTISPKLLRDNFYLKNEVNNICPIIEDTRSSAVAAITGNAPFATLVDGQRIILKLAYAKGAMLYTLNLTLSNGATTGAIDVYFSRNAGLDRSSTTSIAAGSYVELIYDNTNTRWVSVGQVDTNTTYPTMSQAEVDAGTGAAARVISPKLLCDNFSKVTTLVEVQTTGDVTQALESGKFYRFGTLDSLTITLTAAAAGLAQYGGKFTASASWSALALPVTVDEASGNDTVASGKTYEFNILDNVIAIKEV